MLSMEEKIEIILIHGENRTNRDTANIFNQRHPNKFVSHSTVGRIVDKFKSSGSVLNDFKKPHVNWQVQQHEEHVLLDVVEHKTTSIAAISNRTGAKETTVRKILKKHKYRPFKPKYVHILKERDFNARFDFCMWFQGELEENRRFPKEIMFSDEATFSSNGTVSSQNCRWWADENPNFIIECRDQYSFKTNVWCGIFYGRLIGPYFFHENLNSQRYLNFLMTEITDLIDDMVLEERSVLWFQQDGASIHSTLAVRSYLNQLFGDKWIGRYSAYPWPARSPDLTPLDFSLWGYLKEKVYRKRPFRNIEHLENTIRDVCLEIPATYFVNITREFSRRIIKCIAREGRHTEM